MEQEQILVLCLIIFVITLNADIIPQRKCHECLGNCYSIFIEKRRVHQMSCKAQKTKNLRSYNVAQKFL